MGTLVQILNTGGSRFPHPLLLGLNDRAGCQFEDTQQERVKFAMECGETCTVSWWVDIAFKFAPVHRDFYMGAEAF